MSSAPRLSLLAITLALAGAVACQGTAGIEDRAGRSAGGKGGAAGRAPGPGGQGGETRPPEQGGEPDAGAGEEDAGGADPAPEADGSTDSGPSGPALSALPSLAARFTCERVFNCCTAAERAAFAADRETCEEDVSILLRPFTDALARSVNADRADFQGARLSRCLDELAASACPQARGWEVLALTRQCPFVTPKVAAGGACQWSFECADGHCLDGAADRDGKCVSPKKPDGQSCDGADDCSSGACHPTLDVCAAPQAGTLCE